MPRHSSRRVTARLALLALALLPLFALRLSTPATAQSADERPRAYLPLVGGASTGAAPAPSPTPAPDGESGAFFFEPATRTASSSIAVDAQGGAHAAYIYDVSQDAGGADVVYSSCPPPASRCTTEAGWRHTRLFGPASEVQLQLTPDGKPRILAGTLGSAGSAYLHMTYTYAACDANCLDAASWQSAEVASVMTGYIPEPRETPRRSFALDHQGRPGFVATDHGSTVNDESRYGTFLFRCAASCTSAASWTAAGFTPVNQDTGRAGALDNAALRFTSAGQPRILGEYYPAFSESGDVTSVVYFACDGGCDDRASWSAAPLSPRGSGPKPAWDLELTPQGQPRAVVFHQETGDERENRIFYFQCDTGCGAAGAWTPVNLDLAQNIGLGADLALDAAGRPRIAHLASSGALAYSWCQSGCADTNSWLHGVAEKPEALDAARAVTLPIGCVAGLWDNYGVNLALDPRGDPRISYDATYQAQCAHSPVPGQPPTAGFYEVGHLIRMYLTSQP